VTTRVRTLKDLLWALALAGLVAGVFRLWFGLGATTNLSDAVPWGLWKILNMVAGVAISTSGFTVGFLVYVLGLERFRPLMKPAILVAFLGYGCSCLALLFDIGLPQRFWHPIVMWNEHSFLFEVFWCVLLYFTVTAIELAPVVFEKLKARKVSSFLHQVAFWVVVVGISLSSLHHSSLGSLFLVTPRRLHPLWYSPQLPLLFILSAMGAGMMFLVLVRYVHALLYDPEAVFGPSDLERQLLRVRGGKEGDQGPTPAGRDVPTLRGLASIATGVLGAYLLVLLYHLVAGGAWRPLLAGTWESWLFGLETLLIGVVPGLLVWLPGARGSPRALFLAALSASGGLALNRVDVGIFGYFRDAGAVYVPSVTEWALSLGVVAAAGLVFLAFVEVFPIFQEGWEERRKAARLSCDAFDSFTRVWVRALSGGPERITLIAVVVVPVAWAAMYPPFGTPSAQAVQPASGLDVTRATLLIDGDRNGVRTDFPHAEHQERLGGDTACVRCHHLAAPGDQTTPCSRCHRRLLRPTLIFDHRQHQRRVAEREELAGLVPENLSCAVCHTRGPAKTAETAQPCSECHREEPGWATLAEGVDPTRSPGYAEAMHGTCVECHETEATERSEPALAECATCHRSLEAARTGSRSAEARLGTALPVASSGGGR
jgi:Ni/Fe-hydrogenase subunit HybB-like protein